MCCSVFLESPSLSPPTRGHPEAVHLPRPQVQGPPGLLPTGWKPWKVNSFHLWLQPLRGQFRGLGPQVPPTLPSSHQLIPLVQFPAPVPCHTWASDGSWQPVQGPRAGWFSPAPSPGRATSRTFCLNHPPQLCSKQPIGMVWASSHWVQHEFLTPTSRLQTSDRREVECRPE